MMGKILNCPLSPGRCLVNRISVKSVNRLMGYMEMSIYGLVNLGFIIGESHNSSENIGGSLRYRNLTKFMKLYTGNTENPVHGFM
jgi:hypothetical protein